MIFWHAGHSGRPFAHVPDKLREKIGTVLRARGSFRVILHGENGPVFNAQPLVGLVEQGNMGLLD